MLTGQRRIVTVVSGEATSDGAGVQLSRVIGNRKLPDLDPFLLLDEFGASDPKGYIAGFPDHPHRGFETVTYMLDGRMRHKDNHGNSGVLGPGGVQWMTAGRGIVHSEMPEQVSGLMRGFQLWINLPAMDKMAAPRYQNIEADGIPLVETPQGGTVKVIAGQFMNVTGPITAKRTQPLYLDVHLAAQNSLEAETPIEHNCFVYVYEGDIKIGGQNLSRGQMAVLSQGSSVVVSTQTRAAKCLIVAGKPLREHVARYGPFVMNTEPEIRQAIEDFQAGKF